MNEPGEEADRHRREAERCREIARNTLDHRVREIWLSYANEYRLLADARVEKDALSGKNESL